LEEVVRRLYGGQGLRTKWLSSRNDVYLTSESYKSVCDVKSELRIFSASNGGQGAWHCQQSGSGADNADESPRTPLPIGSTATTMHDDVRRPGKHIDGPEHHVRSSAKPSLLL
jgi:hypothetical protein